jgi:hypothetical protein
MSDMKDRMIEAYERGWCSYEGSYDYVREQYAAAADLERKRAKEDAADEAEDRLNARLKATADEILAMRTDSPSEPQPEARGEK